MKKIFALMLTLCLAALLVFTLTTSRSLAQEGTDTQQTAANDASSAPLADAQTAEVGVEWTSSAPLPAGQFALSVPDPEIAESQLSDILATYDSYYRVAGSALKPRGSGTSWMAGSGGGCLYATAGSTYEIFNAPVNLPHGSIVKYVRMYYRDTNASANSISWFTVYDLYGTIKDEYSMTSAGSAGNGYVTTPEITETVNYNSYAYMLNWRPYDFGDDMQVCGFRIYYDAPNSPVYLPLINLDED